MVEVRLVQSLLGVPSFKILLFSHFCESVEKRLKLRMSEGVCRGVCGALLMNWSMEISLSTFAADRLSAIN